MIAIVGRGNVATHLFEALSNKTEVCMVNPRTLDSLPLDADIILISVSDNAISEIAKKIPQSDAIIAHTSGSIPLEALDTSHNRTGVFYPLQTFTKGVSLDYREIPFFIEGSSPEVIKKLKNLGSLISNNVNMADSEQRKKLHLASVFACNFTNALAGISKQILEEAGIDFSTLIPLMKQTVNKLENLTPEKAQTGPAVRGDSIVIDTHLKMLENQPEFQKIYSLLTQFIKNGQI